MARTYEELDWLIAQQHPMTELLKGWAGINTGTFNPTGLEALAGLVVDEFRPLTETIRIVHPDPVEMVDSLGRVIPRPLGANIHAVQRPDAPVQVLLAIHMDTVYDVDSAFQTVEQLDDQTLRGPGVADAKGGLVVMLYALKALERFVERTGNRQIGWQVIVNSDEEISSPGSLGLFTEAASQVQLGLLFEPSLPDGSLVSSRKGSGNFSIIGQGRSAHAGRDFHHGINAIVAAADVSTQLHRLTGSWEGMTLNVARIDGGATNNVVPATSIIRLNIRYTEREHEEPIRQAIQEILDTVSAQSGVQFELHGSFASPPKQLTVGTESMLHQFKSCGEELGLDLSWAPAGGACDGNRLAALGVPNVDTLGVRGGNIHSHEEFMWIDSLPERAALTALYLMQLAEGVIHPPTAAPRQASSAPSNEETATAKTGL